ncbi:fatty-acyl-CoA synthase [Marinobacter segnicrescens]|uniref:Fatty-acyl-CoA synthase n=3 Tax=Marinobacter TaxID=2742 RepID=A0A1I0I917_9GAMM|nr:MULTISPECIES: long-chain fatty acid--CoA ligase [Marinobacter]SET92351.1 fatty-acyl-CoA synthase [Marinobacter segnicrescens]
MQALMQDKPLLISSLIDHAATFHPETEIVTKTVEGPMHRTNYRELRNRSKRVANALKTLGVDFQDRIGTLAWNTHRHYELYFGVSGSGAILHTVNPRLFPEQLTYIINHAEDRVLFFDISFADMVKQLAPQLETVEAFVAMTDRKHMPDIDLPNLYCYEELMDAASDDYDWPEFDERTASSLCYTSGTTGNPKGVLYGHRSTVLHSLAQVAPDGFGLSSRTTMMPIVPMFHANAWGAPYSAPMAGAKVVLPGPHMDGESIYELMKEEKVTSSIAVPTIWMMLFQYLDATPETSLEKLSLNDVGVGGSAPPIAMIERFRKSGIDMIQAWGMTETSPLGVVNKPLPKHDSLSDEDMARLKTKAGRGVWGVEIKTVNDDGERLPWDGKTPGHVYVRGPWIASGYYRQEGGSKLDSEGFFPTGDIGTIDPDGFLQLVDRSKDVIKSGGEWISSIELENAAASHPEVAEAAIIGIAHPKWQERPLLIAVLKDNATIGKDELMSFLEEHVAKWWLPDDILFVDELPHTATGKLLKTKLREEYGDFKPITAG